MVGIVGSGGEGGIRTLDTGVSPYNGLANSAVPSPGVRKQQLRSGETPHIRAGTGTFGHNCAASVHHRITLKELRISWRREVPDDHPATILGSVEEDGFCN